MATANPKVAPKRSYSAKDVEHLAGADAVRAKASMYLGELGEQCAFTVVREPADNVVDEALNGFASACMIYISKGGEYFVADNGRGIPTGDTLATDAITGKKTRMPALQVVTGLMHGGAKMSSNGGAYAVSRGTHGIGIKGTNFVSKEFEVWSCFEGTWQHIGYRDGRLTEPTARCRAPVLPHNGKPAQRGTIVRFKPDASIIGANTFPVSMLCEWARMSAYFTDGFKVTIVDGSGKAPQRHDFHFPDGPRTFVADRIAEIGAELIEKDLVEVRTPLVDVVLGFSNADGCDFAAFTNGLRNSDRGVHFDNVFAAMMKGLAPHVSARQKTTEGGKEKLKFGVTELREGVVGLVNAKLSAPKFSGQTKDKLVDERADKPLRELLEVEFTKFFASNKALAARLCAKCVELADLRRKFTLGKKAIADVKKHISGGLPVKAMTAPKATPEQRELYLLEGDSAAGGCREARDPAFQEVLPLRGKLKNATRADEVQALVSSSTVLDILAMVGFDPSKPNFMDNLRVKGKIISLTDPDPDGPLDWATPLWVLRSKDKKWFRVTIAELHDDQEKWPWGSYEVVSWNHLTQKFVLAPVERTHVVELKKGDEAVTLEFDDGSRRTTTLNHRWVASKTEVVQTRNVNHEGLPFREGDLQFIQSKDLKAGAGVMAARLKHVQGKNTELLVPQHAQAVLSPSSTTAPCMVRKFKQFTLSDAHGTMRLFCLVVPRFHNFVLDNGLVSGNSHISLLIFALLYRLMPEAFDRKMVYQVVSPEYYATTGKDAHFGMTVAELRTKLEEAKAPAKTAIHHIKGWGELPSKLLAKVAFDPSYRQLMRIEVQNSESGPEFVRIMGDDSATRKSLLGI